MNLKIGDILRKGGKFYRLHDFAYKSRDIVCNQILYNPKKDDLVISHDYIWINIYDIGKIYELVNDKDAKQLLEIVKRKYKLKKLNGISE